VVFCLPDSVNLDASGTPNEYYILLEEEEEGGQKLCFQAISVSCEARARRQLGQTSGVS